MKTKQSVKLNKLTERLLGHLSAVAGGGGDDGNGDVHWSFNSACDTHALD
jgi:hypothetical protein